MHSLINAILLAFIMLAVKHTIADYFLQTPYQYLNKGTYGHPGGIIHAGFHALLTLPVFLILLPSSIALAIAIIVGEFVVHYHLDWSKEQLVKRYMLTHADAWFWHLFGLDQLGHMLTYVAIIAILVS